MKACQKQHVGFGQLVFAVAPRNLFHYDAAAWAVHAPHAIQKEDQNSPERNEFEAPLRKMVVTGSRLVTTRADGRRALAGPDDNFHDVPIPHETRALVDESPEMMAVV